MGVGSVGQVGKVGNVPGGVGSLLDPSLPTSYAGLLAWYEAPPKSLIATPDAYLTRTLPSVPAASDISDATWVKSIATTPDAQTLQDTNDAGVIKFHSVSQGIGATSLARPSVVSVEFAAGTLDFGAIRYRGGSNEDVHVQISNTTVTGTAGATISNVSFVNLDGIWKRLTYTTTGLGVNTALQVWVCNTGTQGVLSYAGTGTGTIKVRNFSVVQDGVINTQLDLRTRWPGLYKGKIDPSTGLPYVANDATQGVFANMPYYDGVLGTHLWGTGAPTIYNPGNATGISLALPAGLVAALAGSGKPWEVIALIKLFAASAASDSALVSLTGATAKTQMISQAASAGKYRRYRVDDGAAHTDNTAFTDSIAAEEVVVRHVFTGSASDLFKGSATPLTADASNPLAASAINCSFTAGQLFYNAGATALAMSVRGIVIRTPDADSSANNIAAGMLARSAATA